MEKLLKKIPSGCNWELWKSSDQSGYVMQISQQGQSGWQGRGKTPAEAIERALDQMSKKKGKITASWER